MHYVCSLSTELANQLENIHTERKPFKRMPRLKDAVVARIDGVDPTLTLCYSSGN